MTTAISPSSSGDGLAELVGALAGAVGEADIVALVGAHVLDTVPGAVAVE